MSCMLLWWAQTIDEWIPETKWCRWLGVSPGQSIGLGQPTSDQKIAGLIPSVIVEVSLGQTLKSTLLLVVEVWHQCLADEPPSLCECVCPWMSFRVQKCIICSLKENLKKTICLSLSIYQIGFGHHTSISGASFGLLWRHIPQVWHHLRKHWLKAHGGLFQKLKEFFWSLSKTPSSWKIRLQGNPSC